MQFFSEIFKQKPKKVEPIATVTTPNSTLTAEQQRLVELQQRKLAERWNATSTKPGDDRTLY